MPPPLDETFVRRIELNQDGTVKFYVVVRDFVPGESVEISGFVTQNSGAAAAIYATQVIPDHSPEFGAALE